MIQRELLTLRHQLQLKADLLPENTIKIYKSAANSSRKLTSYHAVQTQSSIQSNLNEALMPNRPFSADR